MLPNSKRPCLREPNILGLPLNHAGTNEVNTDLIDQQISHHNSGACNELVSLVKHNIGDVFSIIMLLLSA